MHQFQKDNYIMGLHVIPFNHVCTIIKVVDDYSKALDQGHEVILGVPVLSPLLFILCYINDVMTGVKWK